MHCNIMALESADEVDSSLKNAVGIEKVKMLNSASEKFLSVNSQKSLEYSKQAIIIAKKVNDLDGLAVAYNNIARIYQNNKNYRLALEFFEKSLGIYQELKQNDSAMLIKSNILIILYLLNRLDEMDAYLKDIEQNIDLMKRLNHIKIVYDKLFAVYYSKNQINKATNNRLMLLKKIQDEADDDMLITLYHDLAKAYQRNNDYSNSIKYSLMELTLKEKSGNTEDIEGFHFKIAQIYAMDYQFEKSKEHIRLALEIAEEQEDMLSQAKAYTNLANIFNKQNQTDSSIYCYKKALSIVETNDIKINIGLVYNNLGMAYKEVGDNDNALKYCRLALDEKIKSKDNNIFFPLTSIAEIYLNKGYVEKAFEYAQRAKFIALESKNPIQLSGIYKLYYDLNKYNNNYKEALENYQKFIELNDSLSNQKSQKVIAELEIKYKADKKEHERSLLEQKNIIQRNYFIAFAVMFLLLLFFIYTKYVNKKNANDELQAKNEKINQQHKQLEDALAELQEKEKGLIEANITKDKFFSIIAHDLKNPLHAIVLSSDLLLNRFRSMTGEQLVELINSINKAGLHLSTLLENLLTWARAQSNRINIAPEKLPLKKILESVIDIQEGNAKEKEIEIETRVDSDLSVFFDKNMLKTVLRNLISNAIKFSFKSSSIFIEAQKKDYYIELKIKDTGIGMKQEDMEKLFRIDVHHSTKGTNAEGGTGLGLLLCKDFVELNGGSISVESVFEVGTTFTITIPINEIDNTEEIN